MTLSHSFWLIHVVMTHIVYLVLSVVLSYVVLSIVINHVVNIMLYTAYDSFIYSFMVLLCSFSYVLYNRIYSYCIMCLISCLICLIMVLIVLSYTIHDTYNIKHDVSCIATIMLYMTYISTVSLLFRFWYTSFII